MCTVEERDETSVMLRVLRELGRVTLAQLKIGAEGQMEVADQLIPLRVVRIQLPWIAVAMSPERRRPVQRQFFRVPASFSVRFRRRGSEGAWLTGKGINISSGGFCFIFHGVELPRLGTEYLMELTLNLTRTQKEVLELAAEVRWVATSSEQFSVGVRAVDPARRKDLANAVSRLQHLMIRQPEDYLLTETQRPYLRS
jgi:c-di-GMP-binding flagellar brake protein YcgR